MTNVQSAMCKIDISLMLHYIQLSQARFQTHTDVAHRWRRPSLWWDGRMGGGGTPILCQTSRYCADRHIAARSPGRVPQMFRWV